MRILDKDGSVYGYCRFDGKEVMVISFAEKSICWEVSYSICLPANINHAKEVIMCMGDTLKRIEDKMSKGCLTTQKGEVL